MNYSYTDFLALFGIGGAHPGGLTLTRNILEEISIDDKTTFLEVGCGTGQTTSYICKNYSCRMFSIDLHPIMVQKTKERLLKEALQATILQANTTKLPFKNNTFDYLLSESVTCFTVIEDSLNEYYRVLCQGGSLILIEMTNIDDLTHQQQEEIKGFYGISQILKETEWIQLIKESGFSEVNCSEVSIEELVVEEQDFTEFTFSENIDPSLFKMLEKHHDFSKRYSTKLGFRIFVCKK